MFSKKGKGAAYVPSIYVMSALLDPPTPGLQVSYFLGSSFATKILLKDSFILVKRIFSQIIQVSLSMT